MVEGEVEEGRDGKAVSIPEKPNPEKVTEHELTHCPFRAWCEHCVMGAGISAGHRLQVQGPINIPTISIDYMYLTAKEDDVLPTLVGVDNKSGTIFAHMVVRKGDDPYAVKRLSNELNRLGYGKIILKSDQEPAILKLKREVINQHTIEIVPEDSEAYEHQTNGLVENANKRVAQQVRTMKCALEARYGGVISSSHCIIPWMIRYAANILSCYKQGSDGLTAYERLKGKKFIRASAEFGECILYAQAGSAGTNKMESRWRQAMFMGIREESQEIILGTSTGIVKGSTIRRKADDETRWDVIQLNELVGTP